MGGMGIAVPQGAPDVVYLIIEAADDNGGFFRSTDRGVSFEKKWTNTVPVVNITMNW